MEIITIMKKHSTVLSQRDIEIFEIIKKFGWLREDFLAKYLGLNWNDLKVKNMLNLLAYRRKKNDYIVREKIIDRFPSYWTLRCNN